MNATPDLTRKVLGYRIFGLNEGELCSVGTENRWMPGVNKARCDARAIQASQRLYMWPSGFGQTPYEPPPQPDLHTAPKCECACGIYAYHASPEGWRTGELKMGTTVGAVILGWGKMEVHRDGFRSEFAEIAALIYDPYGGPKRRKRIEKAGRLYDVDVICVDDLESYKKPGESIPESLLPEEVPQKPAPALQVTSGPMTITAPTAGAYYVQLSGPQKAEGEPESDKPKPQKRFAKPVLFSLALNALIAVLNLVLYFAVSHSAGNAAAAGFGLGLTFGTYLYGRNKCALD